MGMEIGHKFMYVYIKPLWSGYCVKHSHKAWKKDQSVSMYLSTKLILYRDFVKHPLIYLGRKTKICICVYEVPRGFTIPSLYRACEIPPCFFRKKDQNVHMCVWSPPMYMYWGASLSSRVGASCTHTHISVFTTVTWLPWSNLGQELNTHAHYCVLFSDVYSPCFVTSIEVTGNEIF